MRKERKILKVSALSQNNGQLSWLPKNPRQWTQTDIDRTAKSIREDEDFLEDRPLLVVPDGKKYVVFAGNLRLTAAKKEGLTELPCVVYNPETDDDHLTVKRRAMKDRFCDIIVWNKSKSMPLGLPSHAGCVGHRCELIFCFNKTGNRAFSHPQWEHGAQINRIDTENASGNEYAKIHAATFPVALPFEVIKAFTDKSVLDLFGGTGTTMIAAEQLGRKCYMMELDPHYCDVIIARWEKFTGNTANKITYNGKD